MEELDMLLKPSWGAEKWILEGWNRITIEEKQSIKRRLDQLFEHGLPFEIKHDKLLYIYTFSLMAQLEVLGIQLPMRFEDKMSNPEFKQRMRAQLVDEIFHAIVFTKITFLLCAPYSSPPPYNQRIEEICNFIRSQHCLKVGMVVMNLICEGLVEEVFTVFYKQNIASELFSQIIEDEHRHVCEADLYSEIGLPDRTILVDTLKTLEDLLISAFSLEPKYTIALSALLGPQGTASFMLALHEKHTRQLKKIDMTPSEKWDLIFQAGPDIYSQIQPYTEELSEEINLEIYEVEMTPIRKMLMTQLNAPGDPTMVAQFQIDLSGFGFFEKKCPDESLSILMMQAVSRMLTLQDSFRQFLSYKKLYQTRSAYVAITEKLPNCGDHIGTVYFKNCHEMTVSELAEKMRRALQMMAYCYKKRIEIERNHPDLKTRLDEMLYSYAHDVYPCPVPGNHSVYLSNIGSYGYTQAVSPLLKRNGLHVLLLCVEKKPVWCEETQSFKAKDVLPVSISADGRIFDGMQPIPELLNKAFQAALQQMNKGSHSTTPQKHDYQQKIDQMANHLLAKKGNPAGEKLIAHWLNRNKKIAFNEAKRIFGDDMEAYGERLTEHSDFKNIADNLLLDYLGFNADDAAKDANFGKMVDKMLAENLELGYRTLASLQNVWLDYVDVEALFNTAYKKIAYSRLNRLAKFIPSILQR